VIQLKPGTPEYARAQAALQAGLDQAVISEAELIPLDEDGNPLAESELERVQENPHHKGTAAHKILATLRALSQPDEDAEEMELMLASVALGMERGLGEKLAESQDTGELDDFMEGLTRWIATLTSDDKPRLIVVPLPRRELSPGQKLGFLLRAEEAYEQAESPL
jgi:hypothetical protein